jgi:hypothetical protein
VGSFWWRDVMTFSDKYFMIASCQAARDSTIYFSIDIRDLGVLKWQFPKLFSFVKKKNISLEKCVSQDVYSNFFTPLSKEVDDH